MFILTPPSENEIRAFMERQSRSTFSYPEVGATAANPPRGYDIDRNRIQLGRSEAVWTRAVEALRAWQMFNIPWVRLFWYLVRCNADSPAPQRSPCSRVRGKTGVRTRTSAVRGSKLLLVSYHIGGTQLPAVVSLLGVGPEAGVPGRNKGRTLGE